MTYFEQDLSLESPYWEATEARVAKLYVYPLKSARGINLVEAKVILAIIRNNIYKNEMVHH
jgi:hypothetical protein